MKAPLPFSFYERIADQTVERFAQNAGAYLVMLAQVLNPELFAWLQPSFHDVIAQLCIRALSECARTMRVLAWAG